MNPRQQFIGSVYGQGGGNPFTDFFKNLFKPPSKTYDFKSASPTPTPMPGEEQFVHDHVAENPKSPVSSDEWRNQYHQAINSPGWNGKYYTTPTPTPQNGFIQSVIKGVKGAQSTFAGEPSPTPANEQYPTYLASIQDDPGGEYNELITNEAKRQGVPASLLKGLLAHESAQFQPKYVGGYHTDGTGRGIAAIDKNAHPEISDEDAFNPDFAIPWAAKTLKGYYGQEKIWNNVLRRYNGGPGYDSPNPGYQGVPVKQRTQDYAANVYKQAKHFAGED